MSKWIIFVNCPPNKKTEVWRVDSKDGGVALGFVKWFGRWRKYAFFPASDTVFEEDCLRDIAEFARSQTIEHRSKI